MYCCWLIGYGYLYGGYGYGYSYGYFYDYFYGYTYMNGGYNYFYDLGVCLISRNYNCKWIVSSNNFGR